MTQPRTLHEYTFWNNGLDVCAYYPKGGDIPEAGFSWEVVVHGGWWYKGNAADLAPYGRRAAAQGRVCFSLEYRLVQDGGIWPRCADDIQSGIDWIFAHTAGFPLDPTRGFMHGMSAGALPSTIAALDDGRFCGIITSSGITDAGIIYHDVNPVARPNTMRLMGGDTPSTNFGLYSDAQAFHHFWPVSSPRSSGNESFLVMHAENDGTVHVQMSDIFNSKLVAAGYPVVYKKYTEAEVGTVNPHYLSSIPGNMEMIDAWILEQ